MPDTPPPTTAQTIATWGPLAVTLTVLVLVAGTIYAALFRDHAVWGAFEGGLAGGVVGMGTSMLNYWTQSGVSSKAKDGLIASQSAALAVSTPPSPP